MTCLRFVLLGLALSLGGVVEASEWIVLPIDICGPPGNVEVMVDAFDTVAVGYTQATPSMNGDVSLARIGAASKFFSRKTDADGGNMASFAMDDYANVFWSALDLQDAALRVGQDMGGLGGMISCEHPFSAQSAPEVAASMAVDSQGLPVVAGVDSGGFCFLSGFDPITGSWGIKTLSGLGEVGTHYDDPFAVSLTFDSAGNTVLAFLEASSNKVAVLRQGIPGWEVLARETAEVYAGRSLATGLDGNVAMAYVDANEHVVYGSSTAAGFAVEEVVPSLGYISANSLAYSPTSGQPSLVYVDTAVPTFGPLCLATRGVDGTWTTEELPIVARNASLAFDSAGNAVIAALTQDSVVLIGQNIPGLIRGDFDLDDTVTNYDVPGFVQAVFDVNRYMDAHPGATMLDLLLLGDYNDDGMLWKHDARWFADSLATDPVVGLPTRSSGYAAFDQADQDPLLGSGTGNFFATALASPKPYAAGDSRGDLTSHEPFTPGVPDGMIDAVDIDYLFAHLDGSDPRADLNEDSDFSTADVAELVSVILGVPFGDANLDGTVDNADAAALASNWQAGWDVGWSDGDFNGDGRVNEVDATIMAANWQQTIVPNASVPEPGAAVLLLSVFGFCIFNASKLGG